MDFALRKLSSAFTARIEALLLRAGDICIVGAAPISIRIIIVGPTNLLRAVMEDLSLLAVFVADPATMKAHVNTILALLSEGE